MSIIGGAMIGAGTGLATNLFNIGSTIFTNRRNERLVKKAWQREDTAVQRRVADMEAAGINPVLAAGSPAASGHVAQMEAPQAEKAQVLEGIMAGAQVQHLQAQDELLKAQTEKTKTEAGFLGEQHDMIRAKEKRDIFEHQENMRSLDAKIRQQGIDYVLSEQRRELNRIGLTEARRDAIMNVALRRLRIEGETAETDKKETEARLSEILLEMARRDRNIVIRSPFHSNLFKHPVASAQNTLVQEMTEVYMRITKPRVRRPVNNTSWIDRRESNR